jgi:outer membrane protein insertion porin family
MQYNITEGQKSYIEKIEIRGNYKTRDKVIRRELAVSPGEVFDSVGTKISRARLEGLQYFSKVDLRPEETTIPNRKDLVVGVDEKNTGNLSMGAGFSSVDALVGFVEFTQSNFDIARPPSFQGGGQKLRLRLQLGTSRQDYTMQFVEPWFLGRKLEFSLDLYYRELGFQSLEGLYDESRGGARLGLRRPLWNDFWIGGIGYTIENVGIVNVDPNAPDSILAEEGYSLLSEVATTLSYDTRRGTGLPDKGQKTELIGSVTGGPLGGSQNFYKLEARTAWYFKGFAKGHVLEVVGRTGVAEEFSGTDDVPFYERYYLGGLYTLRGYDYRGVGPREPTQDGTAYEPVGGKTYWFGSAEYSIPIIERLRLAVFYDIGMVYPNAFSYSPDPSQGPGFNTGIYNDNWGVGVRINLPIGPLRLDYAIPITDDEFNEGSGRFQFGVGYTREF